MGDGLLVLCSKFLGPQARCGQEKLFALLPAPDMYQVEIIQILF